VYCSDLPEEYQCVRTRSCDDTSWVFLTLRRLLEDKMISFAEFTELTISLEGYGLES
jgi:hypothetical protein